MKIYFNVKGNFIDNYPVYFDSLSVKTKDNKEYVFDLEGDFNHVILNDIYAGKFNGQLVNVLSSKEFSDSEILTILNSIVKDNLTLNINNGKSYYNIKDFSITFKHSNRERKF